MVTRKVARSKRDAMAIAEAQHHQSGSETPQPQPQPPTSSSTTTRRRTGGPIVAVELPPPTRASKGKAKAKVKTREPSPPLPKARGTAPASAKAAAKSVVVEKGKRRAASPVKLVEPAKKPVANAGDDAAVETPVADQKKAKLTPIDMFAVASTGALTPRAISTRNGGSRRLAPASAAAGKKTGVSPKTLMVEELDRKLELLDPAIPARFGQLIWAKRAGFPYWPAIMLDPRLLPEKELPTALKELDEKGWVQLFGSRDIRQILFSALASWDDKTHPYREGFPSSGFHRLSKLKDTFHVALNEAIEQEKLTTEERLKIFTTEVVPSLGLPVPPTAAETRRRSVAAAKKVANADASVTQTSDGVAGPTGPVADASMASENGPAALSHPNATELLGQRKKLSVIAARPDKDAKDSRYKVGSLKKYTANLRSTIEKDSPGRDWHVQLLLSQLLDEKAFLRDDLEKTGLFGVIELLRTSTNARTLDIAAAIRTHLTNCTLEEWPTRKSQANRAGAKRPTPTPGVHGGSTRAPKPKRPRSSTPPSSLTPDRQLSCWSTEAVARSFIPRQTPYSLAPHLSSLATNSSSGATMASQGLGPYILSSAAMASVGISPGAHSLPLISQNLSNPLGATTLQSAPAASYAGSVMQTQLRFSNAASATVAHRPTSSPLTVYGNLSGSLGNGTPSLVPTVPQTTALQGQAAFPTPMMAKSNPSLVIFNKDGTLLDFQTTWTSWIESQAWRLETALGRPIRERFFEAIGYNLKNRTMRKGGVFNTSAKHELGPNFALNFLIQQGLKDGEALRVVNQHWALPKEVATFRPRRDLPSLFKTIRELGVKIAIITSDRRDVTTKTLTHLGIGHLVDNVSCGDDGFANSPERLWTICSRLGVSCANTIMVADTADDMVLARTAGCALSVGVLGGAAELMDLSSDADFLVPCVSNVVKLLFQYRQQAAALC